MVKVLRTSVSMAREERVIKISETELVQLLKNGSYIVNGPAKDQEELYDIEVKDFDEYL